MSLLITNATKVDAAGETTGFWMLVEGTQIISTGQTSAHEPPPAPAGAEVVDARGALLTPGLIDMHGHGGGGHSFDEGADEIGAALAVHRGHGTTRSVISLVANPLATLASSLEAIADLAAVDPLVLGSHLEGPFLAPSRRGAHEPAHLIDATAEAVDTLLEASAGTLRQITIAPDVEGGLDAVSTFAHEGVAVAVGHTEADYELAREAFDRGASILTHAFNAMPGIGHRLPGPIVAALETDSVTLEVILDAVHVHPSVAALLFGEAPGRVALITDAMAAAGAPDGAYRLGSLAVSVDGGVATLTEGGALAGSTLTLDRAVGLAVTAAGLSRVEAIAAATAAPARALGLAGTLGLLAAGYSADAVLWTDDWNPMRVWADGRPIT